MNCKKCGYILTDINERCPNCGWLSGEVVDSNARVYIEKQVSNGGQLSDKISTIHKKNIINTVEENERFETTKGSNEISDNDLQSFSDSLIIKPEEPKEKDDKVSIIFNVWGLILSLVSLIVIMVNFIFFKVELKWYLILISIIFAITSLVVFVIYYRRTKKISLAFILVVLSLILNGLNIFAVFNNNSLATLKYSDKYIIINHNNKWFPIKKYKQVALQLKNHRTQFMRLDVKCLNTCPKCDFKNNLEDRNKLFNENVNSIRQKYLNKITNQTSSEIEYISSNESLLPTNRENIFVAYIDYKQSSKDGKNIYNRYYMLLDTNKNAVVIFLLRSSSAEENEKYSKDINKMLETLELKERVKSDCEKNIENYSKTV